VCKLHEDALNVILERVDVPNELSNQDHETEEILPTSPNVILLEAPPPPQIVRKGVEGSKRA
jgi:hypothetical protein